MGNTTDFDPLLAADIEALEASLPVLPEAPTDLPEPWNYILWRRWFVVGFFVTLFGLWFLGRWLDIQFLAEFGGACPTAWGIFLFLGIFIFIRFNRRGYTTHYSYFANRDISRATGRYRRKKRFESQFGLYPQYLIDGCDYYLIWYVPGIGGGSTRSLAVGAEPLLLNKQGKWIDDDELFNKVFLMWSYGLNISPGTFQYKLVRDRNGLKKYFYMYFPLLPELLKKNEEKLIQRGMENEVNLLRATYPAKYAYYRNSIDILEKKVQWAEAHGWDSLTQLRYKDILEYHEANVAMIESRQQYIERYRLSEVEEVALRMSVAISAKKASFHEWHEPKNLVAALEVFAAPFIAGEINFKKVDGLWRAPDVIQQAYRSRLDYARQVDAEREAKEKRKKGI